MIARGELRGARSDPWHILIFSGYPLYPFNNQLFAGKQIRTIQIKSFQAKKYLFSTIFSSYMDLFKKTINVFPE